MIVDYKTDELKPCWCGFKPDHYSIGYGDTPYIIRCSKCDKQTNMTKHLVTGSVDNAIDYWNNHVANMTNEELSREKAEFLKEHKRETKYDGYKTYEYFWVKGKGERLHVKAY